MRGAQLQRQPLVLLARYPRRLTARCRIQSTTSAAAPKRAPAPRRSRRFVATATYDGDLSRHAIRASPRRAASPSRPRIAATSALRTLFQGSESAPSPSVAAGPSSSRCRADSPTPWPNIAKPILHQAILQRAKRDHHDTRRVSRETGKVGHKRLQLPELVVDRDAQRLKRCASPDLRDARASAPTAPPVPATSPCITASLFACDLARRSAPRAALQHVSASSVHADAPNQPPPSRPRSLEPCASAKREPPVAAIELRRRHANRARTRRRAWCPSARGLPAPRRTSRGPASRDCRTVTAAPPPPQRRGIAIDLISRPSGSLAARMRSA